MARYFMCKYKPCEFQWISSALPHSSNFVQKKLLQQLHSKIVTRASSNSVAAQLNTDTRPEKNVKLSDSTITNPESSSTPTSKDSKDVASHKKPIIQILRVLTTSYDILTYPIYTVIQKPSERLAQFKAPKAVRKSYNEWHSIVPRSALSVEMDRLKIDTLEKLFDHAMKKHSSRRCLGTRPVLSYVDVEGPSGPLRKVELGDYEWKTYTEVSELTERLSRNMQSMLQLRSREMIAIFADTREEWLLTAFAAYKANLAVATIFTALSNEGVLHAANETEVTCLFTSEELMPRLYGLLKNLPFLKTIVYMDKAGSGFQVDLEKIPKHLTVKPFSLFLNTLTNDLTVTVQDKPEANDTAIVMYTSGSSGVPKGVQISHGNITSVVMGCADALDAIYCKHDYERYIAFLPLAHIFEFMSEAKTLLHGNKIGYASAMTLTDMSPGLKEGTRGDTVTLKPTIMVSVPLILERLSKVVHGKLKERGGLAPDIFQYFCEYKAKWIRKGFETPLLDLVLFRKIQNVIGGHVKLLVCGGAPLAEQTHEFCRTVLCYNLINGYGLTETSGTASASILGDLSVGRAGSPINGCVFRLVDWEEGGYRVSDTPYPRGELYVGGQSVAKGYFKRENTDDASAFFVENGIQWVKTGDICEVHEDGIIRIIDRKKDLVKLSSGEFISLGRIESILKICPLIENICVFANSTLPTPVAIVVPAQVEFERIVKELGKNGASGQPYEKLVEDEEIVANFLERIQEHGRTLLLTKDEIPGAIFVSPHIWTPESGLVTASLKLKRLKIITRFKPQLDQLSKRISSV